MVFSPLETQLKEAVEQSLQQHLVSNAVFLCERLNAEPSATAGDKEEKLRLLGECYLRENQPHKAVQVLKSATTPDVRYLYALSCYQTGSLHEAERTLTRPADQPLSSCGEYLLAQVCERNGNRITEAKAHYAKALQLNPLLWTAYEKLCKFGSFLDPREAFQVQERPSDQSPSVHRGDFTQAFQPLRTSMYENRGLSKPPASPSPAKPSRSYTQIQELLGELGKAAMLLAKNEPDEALDQLRTLPQHIQTSAYGLCQFAKAHFDKYDFDSAIDYYQKAFREEPHRVEDSDYYSTALWYEKKSTDLCFLLHSFLKRAYYSPQTWVIAGNFYSLQKERETAIKCFSRAIQLNPLHSYAYALCGHEYLSTEDFDKAKSCYEAAQNIDPRMYAAHWGLGSLFYRQEKYELALQSYRAAKNINPRSSILLTYLGVNYKALGQYQDAINAFKKAIEIDKRNPLPRFQLGVLLSVLDRDVEALEQLEDLRKESPKEAHLYIQIGKIHAKLGNFEKALKAYNDAHDLNPKNHSEIQSLIEQLHVSGRSHDL